MKKLLLKIKYLFHSYKNIKWWSWTPNQVL